MTNALTLLETAVLQEMCKQLPLQDRAAFEEQMVGILVRKRVNTGEGFFTYFSVNSKTMRQIHVSTMGCYVTATINGLDPARQSHPMISQTIPKLLFHPQNGVERIHRALRDERDFGEPRLPQHPLFAEGEEIFAVEGDSPN